MNVKIVLDTAVFVTQFLSDHDDEYSFKTCNEGEACNNIRSGTISQDYTVSDVVNFYENSHVSVIDGVDYRTTYTFNKNVDGMSASRRPFCSMQFCAIFPDLIITITSWQRYKMGGWNNTDSLALELSTFMTLVCVARLTLWTPG